MIDHADNVIDLNAILHPDSIYDHPRDVVVDQTISIGEKRAILASWASDAAAVASNPALRELPGSRHEFCCSSSKTPSHGIAIRHQGQASKLASGRATGNQGRQRGNRCD